MDDNDRHEFFYNEGEGSQDNVPVEGFLYWLKHNYPTSIYDAFVSGASAALDDDNETAGDDGNLEGDVSHAQLHSIGCDSASTYM